MGGMMPERSRLAAWKKLKKAAKEVIEAEEYLDPYSASQADIDEAEEAVSRAEVELYDVWVTFPECFYDKFSDLPPAQEILESIQRQEEAIAMAGLLEEELRCGK